MTKSEMLSFTMKSNGVLWMSDIIDYENGTITLEELKERLWGLSECSIELLGEETFLKYFNM